MYVTLDRNDSNSKVMLVRNKHFLPQVNTHSVTTFQPRYFLCCATNPKKKKNTLIFVICRNICRLLTVSIVICFAFGLDTLKRKLCERWLHEDRDVAYSHWPTVPTLVVVVTRNACSDTFFDLISKNHDLAKAIRHEWSRYTASVGLGLVADIVLSFSL